MFRSHQIKRGQYKRFCYFPSHRKRPLLVQIFAAWDSPRCTVLFTAIPIGAYKNIGTFATNNNGNLDYN